MSEVTTPLIDLESQQAQGEHWIRMAEHVDRLRQNPDFQKLILEEFGVHEAARYIAFSGDMKQPTDARADALAMAQAPGHLMRFLVITKQKAHMAMAQREELRQAIDQEAGDVDDANEFET